jgi:hypothetical protein
VAKICARFFLPWCETGRFVVFAGVLRKSDGWMWFFCGEFVVGCVVDVVF